jgi:glyoxylase-like metal-dependent hydrolase (beta-lactamase superfamily II)
MLRSKETGTMSTFLCETCGTAFADSPTPPLRCPICEDERQYVGWQGQRWLTPEALGQRHRARLEDDAGLFCVGTTPSFAINQRALHVPTAGPRILWECVSLVSDEAVAALQARGGVDLIAISHPHFYSAMAGWSEALGGVPILLHEADREWVMRPSARIEYWRGDALKLADGVTLLRCGGHFEGSTALHWQDAQRPRGALLPGDALQVASDRRRLSFMFSYPNYIPMKPAAVQRMRALLEGRAFDDVVGFTWGRNIIGGARAAVDASFERYLKAVEA